MAQNKLYKSKEEAFINNDTYYNYGGWAPNSLFLESAITQDNLVYHYDFSSGGNMVLRNSGGVNYIETIYDLSPNAFHLTQSNTSKQAIFAQDAFGNFCGVFDGIDDEMVLNTPSITGLTGYTIFSVFETTEYTGNTTFYTGGGLLVSPIGVGVNQNWYIFTRQSEIDFSGTTGLSDNFLSYYSVDNSTNPNGSINEVPWTANDTLFIFTNTYISFGSQVSGFGITEIKAKEYLMYDSVLSESRIQQIVAYLKNKWNYSAW
jgi:hypothetical protein